MHLSVIVRASLVAAALATATLTAVAARAQEAPVPPARATATLSLTGTAEISARPDRARVTTGVVTEAETAREALDENNAQIAEVIAALREAGIEEADIQTSGLSVEPRYVWPEPRDGESRPPRIVAYQVTNQVAVLVRDLDALGAVLDQVVTEGANRVSGIAFEVSNSDELLDTARAEALRNALRKANVYSVAAGVRMERILSIGEGGGFQPPRPFDTRMMRAEAADAVPIQPGETTLSVTVNVTWEIAQ